MWFYPQETPDREGEREGLWVLSPGKRKGRKKKGKKKGREGGIESRRERDWLRILYG